MFESYLKPEDREYFLNFQKEASEACKHFYKFFFKTFSLYLLDQDLKLKDSLGYHEPLSYFSEDAIKKLNQYDSIEVNFDKTLFPLYEAVLMAFYARNEGERGFNSRLSVEQKSEMQKRKPEFDKIMQDLGYDLGIVDSKERGLKLIEAMLSSNTPFEKREEMLKLAKKVMYGNGTEISEDYERFAKEKLKDYEEFLRFFTRVFFEPVDKRAYLTLAMCGKTDLSEISGDLKNAQENGVFIKASDDELVIKERFKPYFKAFISRSYDILAYLENSKYDKKLGNTEEFFYEALYHIFREKTTHALSLYDKEQKLNFGGDKEQSINAGISVFFNYACDRTTQAQDLMLKWGEGFKGEIDKHNFHFNSKVIAHFYKSVVKGGSYFDKGEFKIFSDKFKVKVLKKGGFIVDLDNTVLEVFSRLRLFDTISPLLFFSLKPEHSHRIDEKDFNELTKLKEGFTRLFFLEQLVNDYTEVLQALEGGGMSKPKNTLLADFRKAEPTALIVNVYYKCPLSEKQRGFVKSLLNRQGEIDDVEVRTLQKILKVNGAYNILKDLEQLKNHNQGVHLNVFGDAERELYGRLFDINDKTLAILAQEETKSQIFSKKLKTIVEQDIFYGVFKNEEVKNRIYEFNISRFELNLGIYLHEFINESNGIQGQSNKKLNNENKDRLNLLSRRYKEVFKNAIELFVDLNEHENFEGSDISEKSIKYLDFLMPNLKHYMIPKEYKKADLVKNVDFSNKFKNNRSRKFLDKKTDNPDVLEQKKKMLRVSGFFNNNDVFPSDLSVENILHHNQIVIAIKKSYYQALSEVFKDRGINDKEAIIRTFANSDKLPSFFLEQEPSFKRKFFGVIFDIEELGIKTSQSRKR
jgi:hypothetical protein